MTLKQLIDFAKAYNNLGAAVQEQMDDVLKGRGEDCNPNALDMLFECLDSISGMDDELIEEVEERMEEIDDIRERQRRNAERTGELDVDPDDE